MKNFIMILGTLGLIGGSILGTANINKGDVFLNNAEIRQSLDWNGTKDYNSDNSQTPEYLGEIVRQGSYSISLDALKQYNTFSIWNGNLSAKASTNSTHNIDLGGKSISVSQIAHPFTPPADRNIFTSGVDYSFISAYGASIETRFQIWYENGSLNYAINIMEHASYNSINPIAGWNVSGWSLD